MLQESISQPKEPYFPPLLATLVLKYPEVGLLRKLVEGKFSFCRLFYGHQRVSWFLLIQTEWGSWFLLGNLSVFLRVSSFPLSTPFWLSGCLTGMYLGAALGMWLLPALFELKGLESVFLAEALAGVIWSLLWIRYATEPPRSEHPKAAAAGFGRALLPTNVNHRKVTNIPWKKIMFSLPVWAIVVNNFTFHYALYVLMNWLPMYFELGLQVSLQGMDSPKMVPYLIMFVFSIVGGFIADYLITKRVLYVTGTRKFLNSVGFLVASAALMALPQFRTSKGVILCSSVALGFWALGRAAFAVNHMDIAPRYAGIVMGVSNNAGTLAGIIGVDLTGKLLEASKLVYSDLSHQESWRDVFFIPGLLCIFSSVVFLRNPYSRLVSKASTFEYQLDENFCGKCLFAVMIFDGFKAFVLRLSSVILLFGELT